MSSELTIAKDDLLNDNREPKHKFVFLIDDEQFTFNDQIVENVKSTIARDDELKICMVNVCQHDNQVHKIVFWDVIVKNICFNNGPLSPNYLHVDRKVEHNGVLKQFDYLVELGDKAIMGFHRKWILMHGEKIFRPAHMFNFVTSNEQCMCMSDYGRKWTFSYPHSNWLKEEVNKLDKKKNDNYSPTFSSDREEDSDDNSSTCNKKKRKHHSDRRLIVFGINGVLCNRYKKNNHQKKKRKGKKFSSNNVYIRPDLMKVIKLLKNTFDFAVYTSMARKDALSLLEYINKVHPGFSVLYKKKRCK